MNTSRSESLITLGIWIGIVLASILVVLGLIEWNEAHGIFFKPKSELKSEDWGNYGSYLQGTTASLWSLAGFFLILVAFLAQKQQLLRQHVELEDQRKQFQLQHDSLKRQNFESSFFQLLNVHNQIVSAMRVVDPTHGFTAGEQERRGRDCFEKWYKSFKTELWGYQFSEEEGPTGLLRIEKAPKNNSEKYVAFYQAWQGTLGHYFRNLYHVFRFVNNSEIKDKRRYTSLARATLSQFELAFLFYNGLSPLGEKFKPLIEEFGLLENLNQELLLSPEDKSLLGAKDEKPYNPAAFK